MEKIGQSQNDGSILVPRINLTGETKSGFVNQKGKSKRKNKFVFLILAIFFLVLVFVSNTSILLYRVYKSGLEVRHSVQTLVGSLEKEDLDEIKRDLVTVDDSLTNLRGSYKLVLWLKYSPFVGSYVSDGEHLINASFRGLDALDVLIRIAEPYSDILGFKNGRKAKSGEESAQERIDFVVKTIPDLIPKTDELVEKVGLLEKELENIDPLRYPSKIRGVEIRSKLEKGLAYVDLGSNLIRRGKPLIESMPNIIGAKKEMRYMVLFQNDKELRPTGGFITAYTIAKVRNGKFEPVLSNDIYNLDSKYTPVLPAPQPYIDYLQGPYVLSRKFRLRDLNWSPDFYESMKIFTEEAEKVGIKGIDGVIAVDTQLLVNLLDVIGPIGVPGFGDFSTKIVPECNCPQVIYELESFADVEGPIVWSENEPGKIVYAPANYDNRKKIIGPLMNSILANTLGQPKEKIPLLFEAVFKSLVEKHVLFYLLDNRDQKGMESFGIAGRVETYEGDYLHINDANLGGRKSNMYVSQDIGQEIEISNDGSVVKTLTITYKNPEKYDGWLNSVLPNWVRVYVPRGSELISFDGVEKKEAPHDDLGKTVFAGFFKLRPQGVVKLTLKYKLPMKFKKNFNIFIQKQAGKNRNLYQVNVNGNEEELVLDMDKELKFKI